MVKRQKTYTKQVNIIAEILNVNLLHLSQWTVQGNMDFSLNVQVTQAGPLSNDSGPNRDSRILCV